MQQLKIGTRVELNVNNTKVIGTIIGFLDDSKICISHSDCESILIADVNNIAYLKVLDPTLSYAPKKVVYVTKEMTFDSCHNLIDYDGPCARLHGHTYKIHVTLKGQCDDKGFLVDFNDLKQIMKDNVVDKADHRYLNSIMEFNTTAENMVKYYYDLLNLAIIKLYGYDNPRNIKLVSVKLWETPTSFAEYKGECD